MTTPVGRPSSPPAPLDPGHPLQDPLGFPLAFKQWVVQYVTQELQLSNVFGYQAPLTYVTGIIPATGTTPTAGNGFTYTHTDTSGIYVVSFATAFVAVPIVFAQPIASSGDTNISDSGVSETGFTVHTFAATGVATDLAFNFLALAIQ